jgi:hypothetical protein
MGLYRCAVCRTYTTLSPLLFLFSWRVHESICIDCAMREDIPLEKQYRAAHASWTSLWCLLTGRYRAA